MKAFKDKLVHYVAVDGYIDVALLARQLAWLAEEKIKIPTWLAALLCEKYGTSFVFCRNEQIELMAFWRFRKKLMRKYHNARKRGGKAPDALEGLLGLFDALYDTIVPPGKS